MTGQDPGYFTWLIKQTKCRTVNFNDYIKLLTTLHHTEFYSVIPMDQNREEDGYELRFRYYGVDDRGFPCSVLEMMIALANRMETDIMADSDFGNRSGEWFWKMIFSLGLGGMSDRCFDQEETDFILNRFLERKYEPNGRGGLFTIKRPDINMRKAEIWYQMNWYLTETQL